MEYGPWMRHLTGPVGYCDGINHSFLINRVALSGQSGGSYGTDGSILSKLSNNREWTMDVSPHRTRPWRYLLLRNLAVT